LRVGSWVLGLGSWVLGLGSRSSPPTTEPITQLYTDRGDILECSRCGGEAVVKRDNAVYCGKCALARDWEEVIHVVQADRLTIDSKPSGGGPASKPAATSTESRPAETAPAEAAPAEAAPADPFA